MRRALIFGAAALAALGAWGCGNAPGRPAPGSAPIDPDEIADFATLYGQNCSGCHGTDGKGGAAIALGDPVYLAIADDATLQRVAANGVAGTSMPAFAKSAGGMLTDKQIDIIAQGIRTRWGKPDVLQGAIPPPYASTVPGNATRGSDVYTMFCSSCHGPGGRGGPKASSIVDGSYLALVSDQGLRTVVIAGRPELGAPDWRSDVPGKPLTAQDVSDVTAWLVSLRPAFPGEPYPSADKTTGEIR
ncbi:MAG: cytochrome c [Candidatus Acidiferrales bacterium]